MRERRTRPWSWKVLRLHHETKMTLLLVELFVHDVLPEPGRADCLTGVVQRSPLGALRL